jgi:hypothetical protein
MSFPHCPKVEGASSSLLRGEQDAPSTLIATDSSTDALVSSTLLHGEQDAPPTLELPAWEYFNPRTEIETQSGGDLPHWHQDTVWYFITYRLADALPKEVVEKIKDQREQWKKTHDLDKLSKQELAEYYKLFSERYENLLNAGSGACVLRDPQNAKIVSDAFLFFVTKRYDLDEFVIMPNLFMSWLSRCTGIGFPTFCIHGNHLLLIKLINGLDERDNFGCTSPMTTLSAMNGR